MCHSVLPLLDNALSRNLHRHYISLARKRSHTHDVLLTTVHVQHAFPHDYRSGPSLFDWDPSKWLILLLHTVGLVSGLKRARPNDIHAATAYMAHKKEQASQGELSHSESECCVDVGSEGTNEWQGETWTWEQVGEYVLAGKNKGRCVIVINGYAVDATEYLGEHVSVFLLLASSCLPRYSSI